MSKEPNKLRNISLDELASLRPSEVQFVELSAQDSENGRRYSFSFVMDGASGPFVRISTDKREDFLRAGTEQGAQEALIKVATEVKKNTGGFFDIHPFYGAVWGTKLTGVVPGFCADIEHLYENLTMIINFTNNGRNFDQLSTHKLAFVGTSFEAPSPQADNFVDYLNELPGKNPNQMHRDIATLNGFGQRWDAEFQEFNGQEVPNTIIPNPRKIAVLGVDLKDHGFTNVNVAQVNLRTSLLGT